MNLLKTSFLLLLFSLFTPAFALDAATNIILDESDSNSLEISWDGIEWVELIYSVSYWLQSWIIDWYDVTSDVFIGEKFSIEDLESDMPYFLSIKSYDSDGNESEYSEEVSFSTLWELAWLKIKDYTLKDTRTIILNFNVELEENWIVDVIIVNKDDDFEDIALEKYDVNGDELELFFDIDLNIDYRYSITLLSLEWSNWELVNSWVDWIIDFDVPSDTKIYNEDDVDDFNSAPNPDPIVDTIDSIWWTDLANNNNNNNNNNTVVGIANNNDDLPDTGASETLLLLFLSFIAWWLFLSIRRKTKV